MHRSTSYAILATTATLCAASAAHAWHFDYRFVDPVTGNQIGANGAPYVPMSPGPVRLGIQFGVFGPLAPNGGFIAWNVGTITDSVGAHNNRRTPGRLPPFTFSNTPNDNGNPPLPGGDPFTSLTDISATTGTQTLVWDSGPLPPMPVIYGLDTFITVFEFTTTPGSSNYTITVGGNLVASSGWIVVGTPVPPAGPGMPGSVTYAPFPLPPQPFLLPPLVLTIEVPAPAAGVPLAGLAVMTLGRRRRK